MNSRNEHRREAAENLQPWRDIPQWQKPSARSGDNWVQMHRRRLRLAVTPWYRRIGWGAMLWTALSWASIAIVGAMLIEAFIRNS